MPAGRRGKSPRGTHQQLLGAHIRRMGAQGLVSSTMGEPPYAPSQYPRFPPQGQSHFPYLAARKARRRGQSFPRYF